MRKLSLIDQLLKEVSLGLDSAFVSSLGSSAPLSPQYNNRQSPSENIPEGSLSSSDKRHSAGLMRVDHTGEICAQGLYRGQAFLAKSEETRQSLLIAALEEEDHLRWCDERLKELSSHRSYLNFFWYFASFCIGLGAASLGDAWSNGFVVETENQVERHLSLHLEQLPLEDKKSRAILEQMRTDEANHAFMAKERGAAELSLLTKSLMLLQSQAMTRTSYWV